MTKRNGLTLENMALAILRILLSPGCQPRPPAARGLAHSVKSTLRQARFEIIKRNRAVAVVYSDRVETRVNSQTTSCDEAATELIRDLTLTVYGAVKSSKKSGDRFPMSLYWSPWQARICKGAFLDTLAAAMNGSVDHLVTRVGAHKEGWLAWRKGQPFLSPWQVSPSPY